MDFEQRVFITLIGAIIGFLLSQSINLVKFYRRPKFQIKPFEHGVFALYTGNPPEVPAEVELGFYVKNIGRNPALNTRVFVSEISTAISAKETKEECLIGLTELSRPIDVIPPNELIRIKFGQITSETRCLELNFQDEADAPGSEYLCSDTRDKRSFAAKIYITCDDVSSAKSFTVEFDPAKDDWAEGIWSEKDSEARFPEPKV